MKVNYKFTNHCGVVYKKGPLTFSSDGNSLLSPIGNRITVFNLTNHTSITMPFETRTDIRTFALSPDGHLLVTVDQDGRALLVNFPRQVIVASFAFKNAKVKTVAFSPCGTLLAAAVGRTVQVWRVPIFTSTATSERSLSSTSSRQHIPLTSLAFSPLTLVREFQPAQDRVTCLDWTTDSKYIAWGSKDMTVYVERVKVKNKKNRYRGTHKTNVSSTTPQRFTLTAHRDVLVLSVFTVINGHLYLVTVSKDALLVLWRWKSERMEGTSQETPHSSPDVSRLLSTEGMWTVEKKHLLRTHTRVHTAQLHKSSNLLIVGFHSGTFALFSLPECANIHTLSISQKKISALAVNSSGEWLAFGIQRLGQLLVWEWQSERYILKQQGHFFDMNCLAYSPDGQYVATGGEDAKLKIWNAESGLCFVTFHEHTAPITGVEFSPKGQVVVSASLDGTVRAFDLIRYRNFRILTAPEPNVQFSCVTVDPSGALVAAGTKYGFEIFVWSLAHGTLVDVLHGHTAPVQSVQFNPSLVDLALIESTQHQTIRCPDLVSASWDRTVRVWTLYTASGHESRAHETLTHGTDVLEARFSPDGARIVATTMEGHLVFWDARDGQVVGMIEGRKDIQHGRETGSTRRADTNPSSAFFTSVCFSPDGQLVLAGGNSRFVCLYAVAQRLLLKKFQVSHNRSLEGVVDYLDSRHLSDGGPLELIDLSDSESSDENESQYHFSNTSLPGVKSGYYSQRRTRPAIRTRAVRFSPNGRQWACCTTEGLLLYSLDETLLFDPFSTRD
jgi:periodic tryptophan protein 2